MEEKGKKKEEGEWKERMTDAFWIWVSAYQSNPSFGPPLWTSSYLRYVSAGQSNPNP